MSAPGRTPIHYPFATIAFYGPNEHVATKVTVSVIRKAGQKPKAIRHWHSGAADAREDAGLTAEIVAFVQEHQVKQTLATDGVIGCPHDEGVDYPAGSDCPCCPFWKGRKIRIREM